MMDHGLCVQTMEGTSNPNKQMNEGSPRICNKDVQVRLNVRKKQPYHQPTSSLHFFLLECEIFKSS